MAAVRVDRPLGSAGDTVRHPIGWLLGLASAGFITSFLCTSVARLERNAMIPVYLVIVAALVLAYARSTSFPLWHCLTRHWRTGLAAGVVFGALLATNVLAQAGSSHPTGVRLAWSLFWAGGVYGTLDAFLLNVIPVWIVYSARLPISRLWQSRLGRAGMALGASLLVAAAYHLGYDEFRGLALIQPLIGNALLTFAFLLTGSPAAAILAHVIMHAAAVLQGMETIPQLPPHY